MSTVNGFQVGSETLKYNYESLDNYNTPNFSTSSSTTYAVGDYVMYNGKLYKCTTATTGGTWVSGNWTEAVLSDDVSDLSRQLSDLKSDVVGYSTEVSVDNSSSGWALYGDGRCYKKSTYGLDKYQVIAGNLYYLHLANGAEYNSYRTFQWQTSSSVSSTNPSNVISGETVGPFDKFVTAPEGATYLVVARLLTETGNKVYNGTNANPIELRVSNIEDSINSDGGVWRD